MLRIIERISREKKDYVITKSGKPSVVMLSFDEYESLMETLDIMSDPDTIKSIIKAEKDIRKDRIYS